MSNFELDCKEYEKRKGEIKKILTENFPLIKIIELNDYGYSPSTLLTQDIKEEEALMGMHPPTLDTFVEKHIKINYLKETVNNIKPNLLLRIPDCNYFENMIKFSSFCLSSIYF